MEQASYLVIIYHDVYIDNFKDGEGRNVNTFKHDYRLLASSPMDALMQAAELEYITIPENLLDFDEESEWVALFDRQVDRDYDVPTETAIKKWKEDKFNLYIDRVEFSVYYLKPTNLKTNEK